MNRIFHARIPWYVVFFLIMLTFVLISALWVKHVLSGIAITLFLIITIERIIHTTYTITTDEKLVVSRGRFSPRVVISLSNITRIEKFRSMNFGKLHLLEYVVVYYGDNKSVTVHPVKESEFVERIKRVRKKEE